MAHPAQGAAPGSLCGRTSNRSASAPLWTPLVPSLHFFVSLFVFRPRFPNCCIHL